VWGGHSCIDCCPEPIHGKIIWHCSSYFVVTICYVQNCELSYNVLGMTENCNHTEWIYYRTGCGIWLVGGKRNYEQLIEKVLHAGLRFFTHSRSCNLLYALFIFKQVRHTCCLSLHVYVHCIACTCICFCMFLVGYPQTTQPLISPGRLAQIYLFGVDVP